MTLRFLGDADADLVTRCLRGAELPSCRAELDPAASVMGRVVIFGVSGVEALADAVRRATGSLGEPVGDSGFRGHITVGRIRRHAPVPAVRARLAGHTEVPGPPLHWRPEQVELVASHPGPSAMVHEVLGTFAIGP